MNRKILFTGGTGLIGLNLVESLIDNDNRVTLVTRSEKKLFELFRANNVNTDFLSVIECDLLADNAKAIIVDKISEDIDSIVFSARSLNSVKLDDSGNLTDLQWLEEFKMATVFPYQLSKELVDRNLPIKDIVFISSIYGSIVPNPNLYQNYHIESPPNYGTVKASQIQVAKEMAIRFIHNGTRTNCISYGGVEGRVKEHFKNRYSKMSPSGRMLNKHDLFPPLKFILENKNLDINGENIVIDGGWSII